MNKKYNIAVVGATGAVGKEMLKVLEKSKVKVNKLKLLASKRSAGKSLKFKKSNYKVEELKTDSFAGIDIALFSIGAGLSKEFSPIAAKAGAVVIDNSNAFRMDKEVPLIVPEVNPLEIKNHKGIIANPNCSTIQMVVALKPIYDAAGIERLVISTYQAVSGWGKEAMDELIQQTKAILAGREPKVDKKILPYQIAFNLFPHIDVFTENGYTKEEMKMVNETRKILGDESIKITATCVRVPILISHSEAVNVQTIKKISADDARQLLSKAPGVKVVDEPLKAQYPTPLMAEGKNFTYVGRIREDMSCEKALNLWIVSDNLRKGAALNAVQIAELL
ncbi:MAG: aspartate-semialdehyde dehydrogenase [Candidatus Omnitrophota bacterium]